MKSLYEKVNLGGIDVRNRIVRSGTHEGLSEDGTITEGIINLYKKLAEEEVGLIISSGIEITEEQVFPNSFRLNDDGCIDDLKPVVEAVHQADGKIMAQLLHGGSFIFLQPDYQPLGPSAVEDRFCQVTPKEMSIDEIKKIVSRFADAAYRAKQTGFDGVQVQGSAGFLINKFFSPFYNRREDNYGGSLENRVRFAIEIRQAIADKCGEDYPVFIKMSIDDLMKEDVKGLEFEEGKEIAKLLAAASYDGIETAGGLIGETPLTAQYNNGAPFLREKHIELAKEVNVPLIVNGGIRTEAAANDLIRHDRVEAVSFSRPFIADLDLVTRFKNGEDTRCTTCFQCNGPNGIRCIKNEQ